MALHGSYEEMSLSKKHELEGLSEDLTLYK